jgi:hypothetical protein
MAKVRGSDRAPNRIYIIGGVAIASWVPVVVIAWAVGSAVKSTVQRRR